MVDSIPFSVRLILIMMSSVHGTHGIINDIDTAFRSLL